MATYNIRFVRKGRFKTKKAKSKEDALQIVSKLRLSVYTINGWWYFSI